MNQHPGPTYDQPEAESQDQLSSAHPQWSIRAILWFTTLVAAQLALLRASIPLGALTLFLLFPAAIMLLFRFAAHVTDRRIAVGAYFVFFTVGAVIGLLFGIAMSIGSGKSDVVNLLGYSVGALFMALTGGCIGAVYSMFIIVLYRGLVGTLQNLGLE